MAAVSRPLWVCTPSASWCARWASAPRRLRPRLRG